MAAWIGPAVFAAVIAAIVSAIGWFVSTRQALVLDRFRRSAKTRDIQIALRAEIRSELANLRSTDFDALYIKTAERLGDGSDGKIVLLRTAPNVIFATLVSEIHLLPPDVIDPVVVYMRQCVVVSMLVETLNSKEFEELSVSQKRTLVADFVDMKKEQLRMAEKATAALDRSVTYLF